MLFFGGGGAQPSISGHVGCDKYLESAPHLGQYTNYLLSIYLSIYQTLVARKDK
jgi:hypothetical protein